MVDVKEKIKKQETYLYKKINGHGGSFFIDYDTGRIIAGYIGLKGKLSLFLINIKLWLIWKFSNAR